MDKSEERIKAVSKFLDNPKVFNNAKELIDDDSVEAVLIASPDKTHAEFAEYCISKGKYLLLEKPLGLSLADAEKVLKAEVNHGQRIVQIGLMRVFDNQHLEIKKAIIEDVIGKPLLFRGIHKHLVQPGRSAANVITNSAVHDIHSARWLMNDDIKSVIADQIPFSGSDKNFETGELQTSWGSGSAKEDSTRLVLLQLKFKNGGLGTIEVDIDDNYGYEVIVEVSGEKGTLRTPSLVSPILRKGDTASQLVEKDWLLRFDQAYKQELFAWVDATINKKVVGASVWDAYMAMQVADTAIKSLSSLKFEKVPLPEKPNIY
jgi:myo-inositol 2-dehydrogenase/D-chiro-inositol 1-dehydrogenase